MALDTSVDVVRQRLLAGLDIHYHNLRARLANPEFLDDEFANGGEGRLTSLLKLLATGARQVADLNRAARQASYSLPVVRDGQGFAREIG